MKPAAALLKSGSINWKQGKKITNKIFLSRMKLYLAYFEILLTQFLDKWFKVTSSSGQAYANKILKFTELEVLPITWLMS